MNKTIIVVKEMFNEINSTAFCSCFEGDMTEQYKEGTEQFLEKLQIRMKFLATQDTIKNVHIGTRVIGTTFCKNLVGTVIEIQLKKKIQDIQYKKYRVKWDENNEYKEYKAKWGAIPNISNWIDWFSIDIIGQPNISNG